MMSDWTALQWVVFIALASVPTLMIGVFVIISDYVRRRD